MSAGDWFVIGLAILNVAAAIGNFVYHRRNQQSDKQAETVREDAYKMLRDAMRISDAAIACEENYKVCDSCHKIVTKHLTDQSGQTTCIACAAMSLQKE